MMLAVVVPLFKVPYFILFGLLWKSAFCDFSLRAKKFPQGFVCLGEQKYGRFGSR